MRPVNAWLNDISLQDLDGRILVRTIIEQPPQAALLYGENPGRDGLRLLGRSRTTRRITIVFAVKELHDLSARANVVERANAWAQDGILQVSYRPARQIGVVVAARASMQDPRNYNEEYRIDLDAAAIPYWEDRTPETLLLNGKSGKGTINNLGTAESEPTITVTPVEGQLDSLELRIGSTAFSLSALGIKKDASLRMYYDSRGFLRINADGVSKMACRNPDSTDDLLAVPGENHVVFSANTACRVIVEVRGRWL